MRTLLSAPFLRQKGFSLVELMVSLVLGGLIIAAVGTVYLGSRQSFRTQDAMARMQEGARYAFETMSVDLRQVGFGCATVNTGLPVNPDLVDPTLEANWYNNLFRRPLIGYESGAGLPDTVTDEIADTDALMVLRADKSREYQLASATTTASSLKPSDVGPGGLVVVTEVYKDATVYTASAASGTNITLGTPLPCKTGGPAVAASANFRMLPLSGHIYYIGNNAAGEPSLYRETLRADGSTEAQELVEGVEDMQITYGVDTSGDCSNNDGSVETYVSADGVPGANAACPAKDVWNKKVLSVRLILTMRTAEANVGVGGDGRIHKPFTTTIAVRNRLP
jgi:type IV pilus assembly protein PilW